MRAPAPARALALQARAVSLWSWAAPLGRKCAGLAISAGGVTGTEARGLRVAPAPRIRREARTAAKGPPAPPAPAEKKKEGGARRDIRAPGLLIIGRRMVDGRDPVPACKVMGEDRVVGTGPARRNPAPPEGPAAAQPPARGRRRAGRRPPASGATRRARRARAASTGVGDPLGAGSAPRRREAGECTGTTTPGGPIVFGGPR